MQEAVMLDGACATAVAQPVCAQQMPLTFMKAGESAHVLKVRGKGDVHHHLENLGFVAGALVEVVSEQAGNLIVEVKGAQVALDKSAASKIIAC